MSYKAQWKLGICPQPEDGPDKLYLAVGRAISAWERLDSALLMTFALLIGSNNISALRALGRIESPASRIVVLREAYRSATIEVQAQLPNFEETLTQVELLAEGRNAIAHGIVQQIQIGERPAGWYLAPGFTTTRKVHRLTAERLDKMLTAQSAAEFFSIFYTYAMGAARITEYEAEFTRLLEVVNGWGALSIQQTLT